MIPETVGLGTARSSPLREQVQRLKSCHSASRSVNRMLPFCPVEMGGVEQPNFSSNNSASPFLKCCEHFVSAVVLRVMEFCGSCECQTLQNHLSVSGGLEST